MKKILLFGIVAAVCSAGSPSEPVTQRRAALAAVNKQLLMPMNAGMLGLSRFSRMGPQKYYQTEIEGFAATSKHVPFKLVYFDRTRLKLQPSGPTKSGKAAGSKAGPVLPTGETVAEGYYDAETRTVHVKAGDRILSPGEFIKWFKSNRTPAGELILRPKEA